MITPEQLINDLQKDNARLTSELEQAQKDIRDFEVLAIEWKKGHAELNRKHRTEIGNLEQVIEELQEELKQSVKS